nr:MAG TPA: hypothetical protein [Caudoviricetes sp.]
MIIKIIHNYIYESSVSKYMRELDIFMIEYLVKSYLVF